MARRKKATEEKPVELSVTSSDDNFGLPDIDYKPIQREPEIEPTPEPQEEPFEELPFVEEVTETAEVSEPAYTKSIPEYVPEAASSSSSVIPKILGIIFVILLAGSAAWYFGYEKPRKEAEAIALANEKRKEAELKEQQRIDNEQRLEDERKRAEAALVAKPVEGTIETLTERTQLFRVVVASSIDADLIMDFAKKLSAKGVTCKIIPPSGKVKFSRLTIAEAGSFAEAQTLADGLKDQYSEKLWVIKF
jgi:hypothetical protein